MGLEALFFWLKPLLVWLLEWLPHGARLPVHEGGVIISGEKVRIIARRRRWSTLWLMPSWYWWVPRFSDVFTDNVKRKVIELPEQLLTTKDGRRVRAGGVFVYHVTNVERWLVENEAPEQGVQVQASRVLRDWVKARRFDDVQSFSPDRRKEDELTRTAQADVGQDFGIRVESLGLASFAECEARDLHHSGSIEGLGAAAAADPDDEE